MKFTAGIEPEASSLPDRARARAWFVVARGGLVMKVSGAEGQAPLRLPEAAELASAS